MAASPDELAAAIDEVLTRPRPVPGPRPATDMADAATIVADLAARQVAASPLPRPASA